MKSNKLSDQLTIQLRFPGPMSVWYCLFVVVECPSAHFLIRLRRTVLIEAATVGLELLQTASMAGGDQ
jgi:hypothetical protein